MSRMTQQRVELDPLRREAVAWVQRLISGEATRTDLADFERWRGQSPVHAAAFDDANRLWKAFGPAGENLRRRGAAPPRLAAHQTRPLVSRRTALGGLGGLVAASAAAVAVIDPPLALWPSLAEMRADYRTATGEQRNLVLGSEVAVQMNTQTSIALRPAGGALEQVELIAGEASFTAARSQAKLAVLAVLAADGRSVAAVARFDVRRTGSEVCVSCLDGEVRVEQGAQSATVGSGQQIRYGSTGLGQIMPVDPDLVSAWRRGILIFRSTPLVDVVEEVNRYRPGRILVLNAALGRNAVSGRFPIDRLDDIVSSVAQAFGAKVRSLPGGIVILS